MDQVLPALNLLVIRSRDLDRAARFYEALGLTFQRHSHGTGPVHLASELEGLVFEIYPLTGEPPPTPGTRFGFRVTELDDLIVRVAEAGGRVVTPPRDSEWGRRAVVEDPDGHRVELLEPSSRGLSAAVDPS